MAQKGTVQTCDKNCEVVIEITATKDVSETRDEVRLQVGVFIDTRKENRT